MGNFIGHIDGEAYYNGERRLAALGVSLPPNVRVLEMPVRWGKLSVDLLVEALVLEGFTLADGEPPHELRRILQANNFDTLLTLGITEALVTGSAFVVAGGRPDSDIPRLTVHKGRDIKVTRDHTGKIVKAVQKFAAGNTGYSQIYKPGVIEIYRKENGVKTLVERQDFSDRYPGIPIVEIANIKRIGEPGRSEIEDIHDLIDAASRSLTNLQVAQEMLSMPTKYLFGDGVEDQFVDENGNLQSKIKAYFGNFLIGPSDAKAGAIPGADLNQIINSFKLYAQQVSAMTGIPPFMMGVNAESNPASAEAMRSAKDRLISRAELKQHIFGDAVEDIARMVLAISGVHVENIETLEARWRDPAVASISSRNALMLQAQAQGVISAETAREYLGLSPEQIAREDRTDQRGRAEIGA